MVSKLRIKVIVPDRQRGGLYSEEVADEGKEIHVY